VLEKTAEREALGVVTLERLVNVIDAQGRRGCAPSTIMIGRVALVLFRFKRVHYTHLVLGSTSVE